MASERPEVWKLWYTAVDEACEKIAPLDPEWDKAKLVKKISEYLKKAVKELPGPEGLEQYLQNKTWEEVTVDFVDRFYELFFTTFGDRPWTDQHDFHLIIAAAIKCQCAPQGLALIPDEQFHHKINVATMTSYDAGRFYFWSRAPIKQALAYPAEMAISAKMKKSLKETRDAIDAARINVVRFCPNNIGEFMSAWIKETVHILSQSGLNPRKHLPQDVASRLFTDVAVQGKGVPLILLQMHGLSIDLEAQVQLSCRTAYVPHQMCTRLGLGMYNPKDPQSAEADALAEMQQWFGSGFGGAAAAATLPPLARAHLARASPY